jgi:glycosyltransferase involved in cell wall biosynthesis
MPEITVVIPAKNESGGLIQVLPELAALKAQSVIANVVVVSDGSTDDTVKVAQEHGANVVEHTISKGNGAAIKAGLRTVETEWVLFMDGDGQHKPEDIPSLIEKAEQGYDMVVGARDNASQAGLARLLGNQAYNFIATKITKQKIEDLTSGFRLVKADKAKEMMHLFPNGFSYPTTITMSFLRVGYSVAFIPIKAMERVGKSHLKVIKDGAKFFVILFKIAVLYSPLRVFVPISAIFFLLGFGRYSYTYFMYGKLTNVSVFLFITAVLVFLMGILSEQINILIYSQKDQARKE